MDVHGIATFEPASPRYHNHIPTHYISTIPTSLLSFRSFLIFIMNRIKLIIIVGSPIPIPTPMAILSLSERPLLADEVDGVGEVDTVDEVDDEGVIRELVVVDDSDDGEFEDVDDNPTEEDKVPELELPSPARHSYLIPFATSLVVCTSAHCSARPGVMALFKSS